VVERHADPNPGLHADGSCRSACNKSDTHANQGDAKLHDARELREINAVQIVNHPKTTHAYILPHAARDEQCTFMFRYTAHAARSEAWRYLRARGSGVSCRDSEKTRAQEGRGLDRTYVPLSNAISFGLGAAVSA
jgi:hypothetical protein